LHQDDDPATEFRQWPPLGSLDSGVTAFAATPASASSPRAGRSSAATSSADAWLSPSFFSSLVSIGALGLRCELVSQAGLDGFVRVERHCVALPFRDLLRRVAGGCGEDRGRHAVNRVEIGKDRSHGLRVKDVKTAAGRRRIVLPGSAVAVLRTHQLDQKKAVLAAGSADGLVFPYGDGTPWKPRNFTKAMKALATAAGIARFSPHAGRHDHFTRLLKGGIHPKVAQVRAGHSSVVVTLDIYSHVTDGMQQAAAEQIDNVLGPVAEK
jgi:hypothetical protein